MNNISHLSSSAFEVPEIFVLSKFSNEVPPPGAVLSKFSAESGQGLGAILQDKNNQREANGGKFLWGIGNNVMEKVVELAQACEAKGFEPLVLFVPLKDEKADSKKAREIDIVEWKTATDYWDNVYTLNETCKVISKAGRTRHEALVCCSTTPLERDLDSKVWLNLNLKSGVRMYGSGSNFAASRTTGAVSLNEVESGSKDDLRQVQMIVKLVHPYIVKLTDPEPVALNRP